MPLRPEELWLNVLAQRRSFRRIPRERLDLEQYWSADKSQSDLTYCSKAALLKNYTFDRLRFNISGSTFRATDFTHWLALDAAAKALCDAFPEDVLPRFRERTGVFVGNSLTGEFSRAATLRVRWPFVRDVIQQQLAESGWPDQDTADFLQRCEEKYKSHFEPLSEDTLPGSLSNTIAGRICNFFDFKGGGYVLDGACASSLLAVINGCSALQSRDVDVAVCGGVDLSLDPFELVGFARNGALATDEMRVFDRNPTGFLPGEGSGFAVLMRQEDAVAGAKQLHAVIRGWGISSDGQGGMTRPEPQGQLLALQRAYQRANLRPTDAAYFEAHGTGTAAGDAAELTALRDAIRDGKNHAAVVGSIKANIGHTKAAAGLAGLLKTVMVLKSQVLPPTTGSIHPHPILEESGELLRVQAQTSSWPSDRDLIAGVSAMGFGGINTHLVLQSPSPARSVISKPVQVASDSHQDAELFIFSAKTDADLRADLEKASASAASLSQGELSDLSSYLIQSDRQGPWRAAAVASSPDELSRKLRRLLEWLAGGTTNRLLFDEGVFVSSEARELRLCLLFPGQGIPYCTEDWPFYKRIAGTDPLVSPIGVSAWAGETERAQFGIALQCLKQLRILNTLGIGAKASVGHSLGELIALHWAGAMTETQLLEVACLRGRLMHEAASCCSRGAMVAVMASRAEIAELLAKDVVVAALNGSHIVLSGPEDQIEAIERHCQQKDIRTVRLPVEYAFHSRAFVPAAESFERELNARRFGPVSRGVFSTVTGTSLTAATNLASHLAQQIVNPVLFGSAVSHAARSSDVFLELGSDGVLAGMVAAVSQLPVVGWTPDSVKGILRLAAALFVSNSSVELRPLVESRYFRKFSLEDPGEFLRNPCSTSKLSRKARETAIAQVSRQRISREPAPPVMCAPTAPKENCSKGATAVETLLEIVSRKAELPAERLSPSMNLLTDLHLSSIAVAQIAIEAAKSLGKKPLSMPMSAATKTIEQLAAVLAECAESDDAPEPSPIIQGVDSWVGIALLELRPAVLRRVPGMPLLLGDGPSPARRRRKLGRSGTQWLSRSRGMAFCFCTTQALRWIPSCAQRKRSAENPVIFWLSAMPRRHPFPPSCEASRSRQASIEPHCCKLTSTVTPQRNTSSTNRKTQPDLPTSISSAGSASNPSFGFCHLPQQQPSHSHLATTFWFWVGVRGSPPNAPLRWRAGMDFRWRWSADLLRRRIRNSVPTSPGWRTSESAFAICPPM